MNGETKDREGPPSSFNQIQAVNSLSGLFQTIDLPLTKEFNGEREMMLMPSKKSWNNLKLKTIEGTTWIKWMKGINRY